MPVVSADFTICCILWDPFTSPRTAQKFIKYFRQMKNGFSNQRVGIEKKKRVRRGERDSERFERGKISLRDVQIRDDAEVIQIAAAELRLDPKWVSMTSSSRVD